jgi:hypothetical protein
MTRVRIVLLCLAAASALALTACDEDTAENNDYVDQVNEISERLQASVTEVTSASGNDPATVGTTLETVAGEFQTAADDLSEVDPPEDVADLHDDMVEDIETLSTEAQSAADEVGQGGVAASVGALQQFATEATRLGTEIDTTISEINSKLQE